jgi:hypothetical protein
VRFDGAKTRNGTLFRDVAVAPNRHAAASRRVARKVPSGMMLLNAWATGAFRARGLHVTFIELSWCRSRPTEAAKRFCVRVTNTQQGLSQDIAARTAAKFAVRHQEKDF